MSKYTEFCPHKTCGKVFTKSVRGRAVQALAMHVARVHTKSIPTYDPKIHGPSKRHTNGKTNGIATMPASAPSSTRLNNRISVPVPAPAVRLVTPRPAVTSLKFNYCPNCGCDTAELAEAVVLMRAMSANPKLKSKILAAV